MKRQEIQELKNKPQAELQKLLQERRDRLEVLKFELAAGKVKNAKEIKDLKKYIARIITFSNQNKS